MWWQENTPLDPPWRGEWIMVRTGTTGYSYSFPSGMFLMRQNLFMGILGDPSRVARVPGSETPAQRMLRIFIGGDVLNNIKPSALSVTSVAKKNQRCVWKSLPLRMRDEPVIWGTGILPVINLNMGETPMPRNRCRVRFPIVVKPLCSCMLLHKETAQRICAVLSYAARALRDLK